MSYPAEYQSPPARSVPERQQSVATPPSESGVTAKPSRAASDTAAILTAIGPAVGASHCALITVAADGRPLLLQPILADGVTHPGRLEPGTGWDDLGQGLGWPEAESTDLIVRGTRVGALVTGGHSPDRRVLAAITPVTAALLDAAMDGREARAQATRAAHRVRVGTDLISVVSHEIRSPLTSIIGALQTLQRLAPAPEGSDAEKIVAIALVRADRLHTLVDDLLVALRPERAHRLQRSRPIDLGTLVGDAVDAVPGGPDLVEVIRPGSPVTVTLDADRVHRILVNLIDNAIRHGAVPIEVTASVEGDLVEIQVTDHGPGLAAEVALALSTPADDDGLEPVGSGLGLTITRGLVDAVDGTLAYELTPGPRATFTVVIPQGPPADAVV